MTATTMTPADHALALEHLQTARRSVDEALNAIDRAARIAGLPQRDRTRLRNQAARIVPSVLAIDEVRQRIEEAGVAGGGQ